MKTQRKLIPFIYVSAVILCFFFHPIKTVDAAQEAESIFTFDKQYVVSGESLHLEGDILPDVVSGGAISEYAAITIKWYRDAEELADLRNQIKYDVTDEDLEHFLRARAFDEKGTELAEAGIYCSKLPVIYIDTADGLEITEKSVYKEAKMYIQGNQKYPDMQYDGDITIKGRGNSTWVLPKKPYKIKLDKKADFFGFGANKHWVLLANYYDESLMRNTFAARLSEYLGLPTMETEWVDVVMNGSYVGNYQLCEHIRVGESRIDIQDWSDIAENVAKAIYAVEKENGMTKDQRDALTDAMEEDFSWVDGSFTMDFSEINEDGAIVKEDIRTYKISDYFSDEIDTSGGYLLESSIEYDEISKFMTSRNVPIMVNTPEYLATNQHLMEYLQTYIQQFEDATYSDDGYVEIQGERVHYSELAEINTMIDYYLVNEILDNRDAVWKSRYMYKEIDEKLKFGPVWDFDWSMGSATVGTNYAEWISANTNLDEYSMANFFHYWVKDPYFLMLVRNRYWSVRDELFSWVADGGVLDQFYDYLYESGIANDALWHWRRGFDGDVVMLRNYLRNRFQWLDEQMATVQSFMESMGCYLELGSQIEMQIVSSDLGNNPAASGSAIEYYNLQVNVPEEVSTVKIYLNGKYCKEVDVPDGRAVYDLTGIESEEDIVTVLGFDSGQILKGKNCCTIIDAKVNMSATPMPSAPLEDTLSDPVSTAETTVSPISGEESPDPVVPIEVTTVPDINEFLQSTEPPIETGSPIDMEGIKYTGTPAIPAVSSMPEVLAEPKVTVVPVPMTTMDAYLSEVTRQPDVVPSVGNATAVPVSDDLQTALPTPSVSPIVEQGSSKLKVIQKCSVKRKKNPRKFVISTIKNATVQVKIKGENKIKNISGKWKKEVKYKADTKGKLTLVCREKLSKGRKIVVYVNKKGYMERKLKFIF